MTDKMFYIQSKLLTIEGYSVFAIAVRMAAKTDLPGCLQMIRDQAKDRISRGLTKKIIGEELLKQIESLKN